MRLIPIQIDNEFVKGSGVVIGAAGSHDDVGLEMTFGDMWEGLAKHITWLDAKGENPTLVYVTTDHLVPGTTNVYRVPIPKEAKAYEGEPTMSVRGCTVWQIIPPPGEEPEDPIEVNATLSVKCSFKVLESVYDASAEESSQPTPSVAEQLQYQIDYIIEDISTASTNALKSEGYAVGRQNGVDVTSTSPYYHNNASYYSTQASGSATSAATSASNASTSATNASNSATSASNSATSASNSAAAALGSATEADGHADRAEAAESKIENMTATASGLSAGADPTVTKTETASGFNLDFGIPKGDKGDTGATGTAAGFGTPTATIDGNTGTPSVTITASGPDTQKVFNFEFKNLKGPKGDAGAGSGDMLASDYDPSSIVKDSGGIVSYVSTNYVAKESGKGLSTNDYDDTEKGNVASNTSARHTHSNKDLLDTYTQTEADLDDAVEKKHSHSNKALLDTYTQTDSNLANAVTNTHNHSNKNLLDGISSSDVSNWNGKADKPDLGYVTLSNVWTTVSATLYTQTVTVTGATVTNNSKIDLQPTSEVLEQLMDDGVIGIYIVNDNGTLTCTVMGEHPTVAINNIQVLVTEVVL